MSRLYPYRYLLLLCILVFLLFSINLGNPLFWDDEYFILTNQYVHNFDLVKIFTTNADAGAGIDSQYFRPLSSLTFAINWAIHTGNPVGYHLVNNTIHILNGVLIYFLLLKHFKNKQLSLFVTAVFLLHPLSVNTIAYVSGRDSLMAAFFVLVSLLLFKKHYLLSLTAYMFSLLSRETALVLPFLIMLLNFTYIKAKPVKILPYFGIAAIYMVYRFMFLDMGGALNLSGTSISIFERILTFLGIITQYFILLVYPHNLRFRTSPPRYDSLSDGPVVIGIVLAVFLICILAYLYKTKSKDLRVWVFGVGWFFINLGLSVGIVVPLHFSMQEHWLYLPLVGFFIVLIYYLLKLPPKLFYVVIAIYLLFFTVTTFNQNRLWGNKIALWENIIKYEEVPPRMLNNLGGFYEDNGDKKTAASYYAKAIIKGADFYEPYINFALVLWDYGEIEKAQQMFDKAILIAPDKVKIYISAADMFRTKKKWDMSLKYLYSAQKIANLEQDIDLINIMIKQVELKKIQK